MPRLGWTMETGKVAEWLKKDGDTVRAGDVLFTVESEKAVQEVEALESGILHIPPASALPGTEVPVGAVLAYLVQPGEPVPFEQQAATEKAPPPSSGRVTGMAPPLPRQEGVGSASRDEAAGESRSTEPGARPAPVEQPTDHTMPSISPRA